MPSCQLDWYDFKSREYRPCVKTAPEGRELAIQGATIRACLDHQDEVKRVVKAGLEKQLRWRADPPKQQRLRGTGS